MSRQYLSWSIAQLEAEFDRAQDSGDKAAIDRIVHELGFRTTPKALSLRQAVDRFLGMGNQSNSPQRVEAKSSVAPRAKSVVSPASAKPIAKTKRRPTGEQQQAIDQFLKGGSLKINAFAGTGKTSTLEFLASSTSRRGQYIAFNKAIVREAKEKFPSSVNCATSHSLAFKATPSGYKRNEKMEKGPSANQLAQMLNLKRWPIDSRHVLQPRSQGYLIVETLRRFMQSADIDLAARHVPRHGSLLAASDATMKAVTEFALHGAKHVWTRMKSESDPMPLGHDGYLKLWALSGPVIAADFILLDEAQDTNPVVLDVLGKQSAQMIYVGDRYQQIYEWRGAVNAMDKMKTQSETYLTTSFRFGQAIADAASGLLALLGETRPIEGHPSITSRIGHVVPQTILARTNATTIAAIIEALDANKRPHLVGSTEELMEMLRGVQDLKEGRQSNVPDFFGFDKWDQVVEFAKSGEGDHLLSFVNLVEQRGERQLMWALNRVVAEDRSDLIISTVHKAKGREWKTVRLMDDFMSSHPKKQGQSKSQSESGHDPAEVRLLYVAMTRAKEAVDIPQSVLSLLR